MDTEPRSGISGEADWGEYGVSLKSLLSSIRRRIWAVALLAFALPAVALGISLTQTPIYGASAELLVGQKQEGDEPIILARDVQGLQQLAQTVVEAVHSNRVADEVIRELNLPVSGETFGENLSVQQVNETQFVTILYKDTDPERAARVADAVGAVASRQISEVSPGANSMTAVVWEEARTPDTPVSPDLVRNGILALALGLMLGVGLAFLLEYLDDSWRSPEEVELVSGVATFGIIPKFAAAKRKRSPKQKGAVRHDWS